MFLFDVLFCRYSPYVFLCFPVDQYHLLYCGWPAALCFLCFQIEKHPSCFLSMLQYMQFLSMSIHAALMLPFFRRIQPRGIVIICFCLMSCSVVTRRPATYVFPLISDWPAAFIIPFHPTTRNRRLCFSVYQRHLCFFFYSVDQQPLCFLCFRLLTTSLYVSNSCLAIHAVFMFPLFRGISPRRIVIICFVLCSALFDQQPLCFKCFPQPAAFMLHFHPTAFVFFLFCLNLNVSKCFPVGQQPLYVSNVFR